MTDNNNNNINSKKENPNSKKGNNKKKTEIKKMPKVYDLEERTYQFALDVRLFIKKIPKTIANIEDGKQVVRSSGSVGANYIEANEKVGEKDLKFRLKIARKEAKETIYWLRLITNSNENIDKEENKRLINEAFELRKILSAILNKLK